MYMYLKSTDCIDIFPENKANHFFVKLPVEINYGLYRHCALVNLELPDLKTSGVNDLIVLCNFISESFVGPRTLPVVQRVVLDTSSVFSLDLSIPKYIPVKNLVTDVVEIIIKNGSNIEEEVSFMSGVTYCDFHFVKNV